MTFHDARRAALAAGIGPAVAAIERGDLGAEELAPAWERATLLAWADVELDETPALARFHGAAHHAQVSAFADLDRGALALARARALVRLAERVPARSTAEPGPRARGADGRARAASQRGPRCGSCSPTLPTLLPQLAPCLLMSPLAVAQLLDPSLPAFDLVVFDEASQLTTAAAAGALARALGRGDRRRHPATPPSGIAAADREAPSLLDDALAARLPELRARWHYRSKHEDLIAFANQRYYGDRLQVFPTAHGLARISASPGVGSDGAAERTDAEVALAEAEAVVADALARLRDPAQRTRSIGDRHAHRRAAGADRGSARRARAMGDPTLEALLEAPSDAAASFEPLLVRTVERVQGDERDVILLAIGAAACGARRCAPLDRRAGSTSR